MSTRVGTLQGSRAKGSGVRSIWPAAILASLTMLTIAVAAVSLGGDRPQPTPQTVSGVEKTFVGGTAANTPSELRGAVESNVGGIHVAPHVPRRAAEMATRSFEAGNTPSELSGGLTPIGDARALHQRI
jgi:hypothetical protein